MHANTNFASTDQDLYESAHVVRAIQPEGGLLHGLQPFEGEVFIAEGLFQFFGFEVVDRTKLVGLKAQGDAMSPAIGDGQVMVVDTGTNSFTSDGVYLFEFEGVCSVKRLQRNVGGPLCAVAVNPSYPVMELEESDIRILGRVLPMWHCGGWHEQNDRVKNAL